VVAKRLHRDWIGIEREAGYVELAEERIKNVSPERFDESVFETPSRRKQPRVPFSALLEQGYLHPGQKLYFSKSGQNTATVCADGKIDCQGQRGSIHQVACQLKDAPCNGWEVWYYIDEESGGRRPIDNLRAAYREEHMQGKTV
jgi:modification methylase